MKRALGFAANSITASDFNGDGMADLAFTNGISVAVVLSTGGGSFAAPMFFSAGIAPN
jgi:hypothetical protein